MEPNPTIENARIESTMLGIEDHGILTCWLMLKFDVSAQGFGGYAFDTPRFSDPVNKKEFIGRVGTDFGMEFVRRVLDTVGVSKWEDLKGKHVRVKRTHSKVLAIGHIIEDTWLDPEALAAEYDPATGGAK